MPWGVKPGEIAGVAGGICELDLSGNHLPDWDTIQRFNSELPTLKMLDLRCVQWQVKTLQMKIYRCSWQSSDSWLASCKDEAPFVPQRNPQNPNMDIKIGHCESRR
eukprot:4769529-Pyramimonas_sp.AAC.2